VKSSSDTEVNVFDRPIIVLASPRSGSTLFYETLTRAKDLWTVGGESHAIIEEIPEFSTIYNGSISNALTENDGTTRAVEVLRERFQQQLRDSKNNLLDQQQLKKVRFLEKTPKNSLRIRFLNKVFPDAIFVHLIRDPKDNISSIIEGWRSGHFITYPHLPGFNNQWSYLLPPKWEALKGKPIEEVATFQWQAANQAIIDDLKHIPESRQYAVNYQDFLDNTGTVINKLCNFIGIEYDAELQHHCEKPLPYSRYTLTKPEADKWQKNKTLLAPNMPQLDTLVNELNANLTNFSDYQVDNII
jgi:hypothetical protein